MNSILSFLLSLSTLLSSFTGAALAPEPAAAPESAAAPGAILTALRPDRNEISFRDIQYTHYDPEGFYSETDHLRQLADAGDTDGVNTLYDALYDEFLYIDTLSVFTMLRSDGDIYDDYWAEEYSYMNLLWSEAQDALYSACGYVLETDCADAFTEHVGADAAALFRGHAPLTREELDAADREMELVDEYQALYDDIDGITYEYNGQTWDMDKLFGFPGTALSQRDYDAYLTVYYGLQQTLCETFAPIYIELAELWRAEARNAGYDTCSDYAYDYVYHRDYTPEDAQRLCDAIKPIARTYYADLYYSDMNYAADAVAPVYAPEELVALLGEYLPRVDPSLLEPWEAMTGRGLYDLAPASSGRYSGAYTTTMLYYHSPFLFASLEGSCYDLITMTHEFGHFSDFWFNPQTNIFTQVDDLDLSEIHSNALQALFTAFYGEIYDSGADVAEFINLANLLENIIDGCVYDEFQRRVLDSGEPLTPELINRIHVQVCSEYGLYDEREWDSTWVYIAHNFEQPLYYISYAASAMAALQIWDMAQTDFDAAVDVYLDVLHRGAHGDGYFTVLEECGLRLFRSDGVVEAVCRPVLDRLEALDAAYAG